MERLIVNPSPAASGPESNKPSDATTLCSVVEPFVQSIFAPAVTSTVAGEKPASLIAIDASPGGGAPPPTPAARSDVSVSEIGTRTDAASASTKRWNAVTRSPHG